MFNQGEIPMEEINPKDKFERLQAEEIKIAAKLSTNQYIELILGFLLIRKQPIQAKFCCIRALQRCGNDKILKQIWALVLNISKKKVINAIYECDKAISMVEDQYLRAYIEELKKRLVVEQLQIIASTYSSIPFLIFYQLIGSPNDEELKKLLEQCNWEISNNYITPTWNVYFANTLEKLNPINNIFPGSAEDKGKSEVTTDKKLENLSSLVDCSIFFDAVSTKISNTNSGGGSENNPTN